MRKNPHLFYKLAASLLLSLLGLAFPQSASAQFVGYTSPQTVQTTLATALACTGSAQTFITGSVTGFDNLGQNQHTISITGAGTPTTLQAEIDGIDKAGNVYRISDMLRLPFFFSTASLTGFGSFPKIQVQVTCSPGTATFTLSYTGTSSASPVNAGSYQMAQLNKLVFRGITAGSSQSDTIQTPFGNSAGVVQFTQSATLPGGSSFAVNCNDASGTTQIVYNYSVNSVGSTQYNFPVPANSCPFVAVIFTSGGASATTITVEYSFAPNGALAGTYMYTPAQLNVNLLTEPGAGTTALSNVIPTFGVKYARLSYSCTAGTISVNVQTYTADAAVLTAALVTPVSGVAAATAADLYIGSDINPGVDTGTLATPPAGVVRFPQPYLAFSFTNAGGAGTCTARLFVTY